MQRFINPYNFISLGNGPERGQKETKTPAATAEKHTAEEKLTGSITYTLRTGSRLFIPNTSSSRAFSYTPNPDDDPKNEHGLYDFFSYEILDPDRTYDGEYFEPVIPGSEVRGMVRSIYETLTNSCLPVLDGEKRIGKRTAEHFRPAVLKRENGEIHLYDIVSRKGNGDAVYRNREDFSEKRHRNSRFRDGMEVSFSIAEPDEQEAEPKDWHIRPDVERISANPEEYPCKGYFLKGNQGENGSPDIKPNKKSKCSPDNDRNQNAMLEKGICPGNESCPGKAGKGTEHCFLAEKHCAHVFFIPEGVTWSISFEDKKESLETLQIVLEQYLKEDPDSYKEYKEAWERFIREETDGLPVYYSKLDDSDYVMLSPACITREVYKNTVNTLVDAYRKCSSKDKKLCPACSLFGIVNSGIARGSRIRFTDLLPTERAAAGEENRKFYDDELLTLDPLAVPHPENTEFYLKKPGTEQNRKPADPDGEVWFWTYDYYVVKKPGGQVVVKSYQPQISGRKYYWNNQSEVKSCAAKTGLNRTVRTVRAGTEFTGTVYFDGISEKELNRLLFILTYTSDGKHAYKLGTGKPLGLGSVELSVKGPEAVMIRQFDENGYRCTPKNCLEEIRRSTFAGLGLDTEAEKPFELITRYLEPDEMACIHYPKTGEKEDEEGFQWFMKNKAYYEYKWKTKSYRQTSSPRLRTQTQIQNELPSLESGTIPWLPAEPAAGDSQRAGRGGGQKGAQRGRDSQGDGQRAGQGFGQRDTQRGRDSQNRGAAGGGRGQRSGDYAQNSGKSGRFGQEDGRNSRENGSRNNARQEQQKTYIVRIISGKPQDWSENYWKYNIEVLNDPELAKRKCILTERKGRVRQPGEKIEAVLHKGTIFNVKR